MTAVRMPRKSLISIRDLPAIPAIGTEVLQIGNEGIQFGPAVDFARGAAICSSVYGSPSNLQNLELGCHQVTVNSRSASHG